MRIVVVGAGFSGSVIARQLAEAGFRLVVVDERQHIGGNAYDYVHESGILVHKYGPHIFHTNSRRIFVYLSRFTSWRRYEHRVQASVDGKLLPFPINRTTLEAVFGARELAEGVESFLKRVRRDVQEPSNAEEELLSRVGVELYEKFFKGYTEKQWGRPAAQLRSSVTARIPIRVDRDERYFTDAFQAIPSGGYTALFEALLKHRNIDVRLGESWENLDGRVRCDRLIYTGPIDRYFGYKYGKLPYRSLNFFLRLYKQEWVQPVATINYPSPEVPFTRTTEMKHLTGQAHPHTLIIEEYPTTHGDPYYPVPADDSSALLQLYLRAATKSRRVRFAGRLGTYRYYNMDQVVAQALQLTTNIIRKGW